jgi:hypothetical protein
LILESGNEDINRQEALAKSKLKAREVALESAPGRLSQLSQNARQIPSERFHQ